MSQNTVSLDELVKATEGNEYVVGQAQIAESLGYKPYQGINVRKAIQSVDTSALVKQSGKNKPYAVEKSWLVQNREKVQAAYSNLFPGRATDGSYGVGSGKIGEMTDNLIARISEGAEADTNVPMPLTDVYRTFGVVEGKLPYNFNSAIHRGYLLGRILKAAHAAAVNAAKAAKAKQPSFKEVEEKLLQNLITVKTSHAKRETKDGKKEYDLRYVRFRPDALRTVIRSLAEANAFEGTRILSQEDIWTP